jgi:hypothetical protein
MLEMAEVRDMSAGRVMLIDEQGLGLRATWHLDRGFVNLSVWREDRCAETFRLSVSDAGRLAGFLVEGLGQATAGLLRAVTNPVLEQRDRSSGGAGIANAVRSGRTRLASWIAP